MSTRSEIERTARRVREYSGEISRTQGTAARQARSAETWWQGEAGQAFQAECQELDVEFSRMQRKMLALEQRLKAMAYKVERIEAERRRRAAEQARQAQSR